MDFFEEVGKKRILVIGDVMLDTYYMGEAIRISPEAPVPILKKQKEKRVLGGAANVSANLVAAGQNAYMMTVIGQDSTADILLELLNDAKVNTSMVWKDSKRVTTEKLRILGQSNQQIMRVDVEDSDNIRNDLTWEMLNRLETQINMFDVIVLSDYLKGILSYEMTQGVIELGRRYNIKVIVDVKDPNINKYKGAYLLKPNLHEVRSLTKMPAKTDGEIVEASLSLCQLCDCEYVLTTCGERGMVLIDKYGVSEKFECYSKEVYDVTGAGDTVIAYLATGMANNISMKQTVRIANIAAGIKVSKVGTSAIKLYEVKQHYMELIERIEFIKGMDEEERDRLREENKKIVFTNGCFDILHTGHVKYLQKAKEMGDILVVGVNSDESVKRLKGPDRPINKLEDRMELLSALKCVDYVMAFQEDTPLQLIKKIKPDILVKGADYTPDNVVGREFVESTGGRLELIQYIDGKSTTNIISKIKN